MGLFKVLKKVYTEEYEEYEEDLEEIEDIAYDLNVMLPEPDTLSEQDEEARYDEMLDRVLDRERTTAAERTKQSEEASSALSYQSQAVKLPDVTRRPKKLDDVHIEIYDKEETRNYVKDQCEVMAEASEHIELAMAEYSVVTEHFADIELLENAPEKLRSAVFDAAERVDNLTVDRRIFKSAENKLSANAYHRMETLEEELPKGLAYVQQQETYYEAVKRDMQILEGERMALRLEAHGLDRRQRQIKSGATAAAICLAVVFSIFVIAMIAMEDEENLMLWDTLQNEFTFEERKEENTMAKNTEFAGKTIVATGKLENFTRAEINDKILEIGAKPGSSVTGKTDYLVCGEKAGSKLAKAKSLGITILSEAEFLAKIS